MDACKRLELTISEYKSSLSDIIDYQKIINEVPWERVQKQLCSKNDWTREGAEEITKLVKQYGGFMLRNALAVADVIGVEDGELGY